MRDVLNKMFRDFSVRGVVPQELNPAIVETLGRAFGTYAGEHDVSTVVVGYDVRTSSPALEQALVAGLVSTGCTVKRLGLVSTPVWNWAASHHAPDGGVMITASHNPPKYNGVKFRLADPLVDQELVRIKELALRGEFRSGSGQVTEVDAWPEYCAALEPLLQAAAGKRTLVVDAGNGATAGWIGDLLRGIGHRVVALNDTRDGNFPGRGPDPSAAGALAELSETVVQEKADLGLAFDGDGDRLVVVDDGGRVRLGDEVLIVLSRHLLAHNPGRAVVFDLSATRALSESIVRQGGVPIRSRVGYPFVYASVKAHRAIVGGEISGHLFFDDPAFRFDDATVAALRLLCALNALGMSLSGALAEAPKYVRRPPERVEVADANKPAIIARLARLLAEDGPVDLTEGVSVELPGGWALVRSSGTEPLIRVSVEGQTEADCQRIRALVLARLETAQQTVE
ncbi:MAG: phosphomannomutase/phosphoglucomutase [Anaerolineae bacterium]